MRTPKQPDACDFCGLSLPAPLGKTAAAPEYCCFGCRFAADVSASRGAEGEGRGTLARLGLAIFLSMNVMVFTMVLWSQDVYHDPGHPQFSQSLADCFRYLGLLFSLPVMWVLGLPLSDAAWQRTRAGQLSSDLLIVVGVTAAFLYSTVSVFRGSGAVYFEVACVVLVMVTLGRWLEAAGRSQAHSALELLDKLLPETADRLVGGLSEGTEERVPLDDLRAGDRIHVRAGQRMPADGVVMRGCASLDEQILTGESQGTDVQPGDSVRAGCLNLDGDLILELISAPREGTWQRLIAAIDRARHIKGYYERLTDRLSRVFLPLVIALSLLTFALHAFQSGVEAGVMAGLAVVLISCPCALGLATPLAIWMAHGAALRRGVLFASSEALERLAEVRAIACDKTGTLTTGVPRLEQVVVERETDIVEVNRIARGLCRASEHVLARGMREALCGIADPISEIPFEWQVRTIPGRGLVAESDGKPIAWLGSPRLLTEAGLTQGARVRLALDSAGGQSNACLGWQGEFRAVFLFQETLRDDARPFCEACRSAGLEVAVLTGDHAAGAGLVAQSLDLPVSVGLLPDEKVAAIEALRAEFGPVAMVGDGINDAPALAASDVGIALGCGADIARSSADVCLIGNDLRRVPWAIELAHRTRRTIRQNLAWSLVYNVAGIGLAMAGWLNPVLAAISMVLGSAFVVSNSLRWKHELAEPHATLAEATPEEDGPSARDRVQQPVETAA